MVQHVFSIKNKNMNIVKDIKRKMSSKAAAEKPHVVFIPAPLQSHVKAMLEFAKLLHHRGGFHITFVNTSSNHTKLLNARGPNSLDGLPDFQFHSIPDGLPVSDTNASQDIDALVNQIKNNLLTPFLDLLYTLNDAAATSSVPPVSCIFADAIMLFATTAADRVGVPLVYFYTVNACLVMVLQYFQALREKGLFQIKDVSNLRDEYLDTMMKWFPGTKDLLARDLQLLFPGELFSVFEFSMEVAENISKSSAIVIHTFEALEHETLKSLSSVLPPTYAIGPIPLLTKKIPPHDPVNSIGHNFWKEETECLQWLDSREINSVLYVNFGSVAMLTVEQLHEFAWGLASSKHNFLWIIRPDLVIGESAILPPEFIEETRDRGMLSGWCPQEEVLRHPAVGGFLTHCGWNSIVESICAGVPLISWAFMGDQILNRRYSCNEWGIGLEMSGDVKRENVEKLVRELMEEDKGERVREKVEEWRSKAEEAITPKGSSSINFNKLVNDLLLPNT